MIRRKVALKITLAVVCFTLALFLIGLVFKLLFPPYTAKVHFHNLTQAFVEKIDVQLCDQKQVAMKLSPEEVKTFEFSSIGDCHYAVKVLLAGGAELNLDFSYVSGGFSTEDFVKIEKNRLDPGQQIVHQERNYLWKVLGMGLICILTGLAALKVYQVMSQRLMMFK